MPRRSGGNAWKDDASANEVARWFALQDTIGKNSHRHSSILESVDVPKPAVPRPQSAVLRCVTNDPDNVTKKVHAALRSPLLPRKKNQKPK